MHHHTVVVIFEVHLDGIADAHAQEWAGHLAVEGPVVVSSLIVELADELDCVEIDAHHLRGAGMEGPRQIGRIANDVRRGCRRRGARTGRDLDAALHPRFTMARHGAEIDELAGPIGGERHRAARGFANHPVRAYGVLFDDDVVLGAFPVD